MNDASAHLRVFDHVAKAVLEAEAAQPRRADRHEQRTLRFDTRCQVADPALDEIRSRQTRRAVVLR